MFTINSAANVQNVNCTETAPENRKRGKSVKKKLKFSGGKDFLLSKANVEISVIFIMPIGCLR